MVDFANLNKMCQWEREKAMFLIKVAEGLGMDIEGYGELAVNENSGYTYLWLEDYSFTLYMPINCDLETKDVYALWSSPYDGEEKEITLDNLTLGDLEKWAGECDKEDEEKDDTEDVKL